MSKFTHDYFVAGRWRNRDNILPIVEKLRAAGHKVYCFLENDYDSDGVRFDTSPDADPEAMMATTESLADWRTNPTFRMIFDTDMDALRDSEHFVVVLPAGLSAHMEIGAAYGMGKKCYAIGDVEKPETLYLMLDGIYPDVDTMLKEVK